MIDHPAADDGSGTADAAPAMDVDGALLFDLRRDVREHSVHLVDRRDLRVADRDAKVVRFDTTLGAHSRSRSE